MKTQSPAPVSLLSELESRALAFIVANDGASEGQILNHLFPSPVYPNGATVKSEAANAWLVEYRAWQVKAYGGPGVEYRDSYASKSSQACIRLADLRLIVCHNNGFNNYSYTIAKSAPVWVRAFRA